MDAAGVAMRDKLEAKVVLPTNMMMLTEHFYLPEWHKSFVEQFVKFNAIYERWVEAEYGESEDPDEFLTMMKALQNWRHTCDALIVSTNFSTNWGIPAFFPVYNMYCTEACSEYFQKQKKLYASKEEWWDAYSREALAVIEEWRDMFVSHTSPKHIPFPKCLWFHRYIFLEVKEQPGRWRSFFLGTNFNDRGVISMRRPPNEVM